MHDAPDFVGDPEIDRGDRLKNVSCTERNLRYVGGRFWDMENTTATTASYTIELLDRSIDSVSDLWALKITGRSDLTPVNDGVWVCIFNICDHDTIISPHGDKFVGRQIEQALPGSVLATIVGYVTERA